MTKPKCGKWPYDFTIVAVDIIRNSSGSTKAQGLICAALEDAYAAGRASRDDLRKALEECSEWIGSTNDYARISKICRNALSADEEAGK